MAVRFEAIKEQTLIVLYDYMLTSDSEAFFYSLASIRDGLPANISGAFARRAVDVLVEDELVEQGISDPDNEPENTVTYALTDSGISAAEEALMAKGWDLADYHPSPDVDRIISRANEPALHAEIQGRLERISREVRESNEAGEALGDDRDLLLDELTAASQLSAKERFRLARLTALILPTLQFVSSKFFGSALGEAAKQLIALLMKLP